MDIPLLADCTPWYLWIFHATWIPDFKRFPIHKGQLRIWIERMNNLVSEWHMLKHCANCLKAHWNLKIIFGPRNITVWSSDQWGKQFVGPVFEQ